MCAGRLARRAQRVLFRCRRGVFGISQCHVGGGFFYSHRERSTRLWWSVPIRSAAWLNWQDRGTCILFGDGAGAVVLGASENGSGILSTKLRTDGSYVKTLYVPAGGSLKPATPDTVRRNEHTITMNGKEVFKIAVRSMEEISRQALAEAGVAVEQVSLVIPHQANRRIIVALAERLGVPMERVMVNVEKYGNTSAASIPVALDEAKRQGRIKPGDIVLLQCLRRRLCLGRRGGEILARSCSSQSSSRKCLCRYLCSRRVVELRR